jgi:DNA-binding transcriptional ArsR family regulator
MPVASEFADIATLKALANPLRQRILTRLAMDGPATSTTLARALGVTSGATSYNVRILAEHGFVEEIRGRARGRERWWQAVNRDLRLSPGSRHGSRDGAAVDEILALWNATDLEMLSRYLRERDTAGEWADAVPYSRGTVMVTPGEFATFFEEYIALLKRYQRPPGEGPAGARTVLTRFIAFPAPEGASTAMEEAPIPTNES